jgi:hypothetical protein
MDVNRNVAIGGMRSDAQNNVAKTVRARILFVNGNFNGKWPRPRPMDSHGSMLAQLESGECLLGCPYSGVTTPASPTTVALCIIGDAFASP